ncbi:MAG: RES domain-containing protein [Rhodobacteraceae bacterium]|nr:RES domain-containing protein [Paracoccaceae bacterium]
MPAARQSDLPCRPYRGQVWRLVEAQHVVSTTRLVDNLDEQRVLENILEQTKPPVPADCAHLDYLLAAPFRYGCYPTDSRFRRKGRTPGVYYASERPETAVAEVVWYRLRFYRESPDTPLPVTAADYTAIACRVATDQAIDLTEPPLAARSDWRDPDDYSACLDLADQARDAGVAVIRYASARHPEGWPNVALLTCAAFADAHPRLRRSIRIHLRRDSAQIFVDAPRARYEFLLGKTQLLRNPAD